MATTATVPASSTRDNVVVPRVNELEWTTWGLPGGIGGPTIKRLSKGVAPAFSSDPELEMMTFISHIPPWWHDPKLVYHPCVEEGYILQGKVQLADRIYPPGSYLYRPPGILHGPALAPCDEGVTLFHRFASEGGILRYDGSEFPHIDSQTVTDEYQEWPVDWVEQLDATAVPWTAVASGPWDGAAVKWLSRNRQTGGGTLLLRLPPGWSGAGTTGRGAVEEFVVSGSLTSGGQYFDRWGYVCRQAGESAGSYAAQGETELICVWDVDEF